MTIEHDLGKLVEEKTSEYSREEWSRAQKESSLPIYNYRLDHVRHVVEIAKILAEETGADQKVVILAALLHDIAKPGIVQVQHHGEKSAKIAEEILRSKGVTDDIISKVSDVIRKHVGLTLDEELHPVEAQVIWEADKIDKLGIVGFIHFIVNGARMFPGMMIEDMAKAVRESIPLAERIAASMFSTKGKEMSRIRLEHLREISSKLDYEISEHHGVEIYNELHKS